MWRMPSIALRITAILLIAFAAIAATGHDRFMPLPTSSMPAVNAP
jgi:hypothetical protein